MLILNHETSKIHINVLEMLNCRCVKIMNDVIIELCLSLRFKLSHFLRVAKTETIFKCERTGSWFETFFPRKQTDYLFWHIL